MYCFDATLRDVMSACLLAGGHAELYVISATVACFINTHFRYGWIPKSLFTEIAKCVLLSKHLKPRRYSLRWFRLGTQLSYINSVDHTGRKVLGLLIVIDP